MTFSTEHSKRFSVRSASLSTRHGRREAPSRGARDRRASAGAAADASRRQVTVEAVSPRVGGRRRGRRTYRGLSACRVMRVHFGVRMAEMHHEHSDTPAASPRGKGTDLFLGYLLVRVCLTSACSRPAFRLRCSSVRGVVHLLWCPSSGASLLGGRLKPSVRPETWKGLYSDHEYPTS